MVGWNSYTLRQVSQITSLDVIVCFKEYLTKSGLSDRIVFQVKFVKPVERIRMGVHVQRIDG